MYTNVSLQIHHSLYLNLSVLIFLVEPIALLFFLDRHRITASPQRTAAALRRCGASLATGPALRGHTALVSLVSMETSRYS